MNATRMADHDPNNLPIVEPGVGDGEGEGTRSVHTPRPDPPAQPPVGLATYRSSTFEFETAQDYADVLGDVKAGYTYSRIDNPTSDAFALGVAALESHGVDRDVAAQPFASGMAAISTVLLTLCARDAHVVAPAAVYGGTFGVLDHVLARFGVETTYVDGTDTDAVRAAIRDNTAVVWAETIANPTTAVADLPALAAVCREAGVPLAVDSTFASPVVCRPLEWGADLVVHSATKYLGGHSDVTGGGGVGGPGLPARVRAPPSSCTRPRSPWADPPTSRGVSSSAPSTCWPGSGPRASTSAACSGRTRRSSCTAGSPPCRCGSPASAAPRGRSPRRSRSTRR